MSVKITGAVLEAAYTLLQETKPFCDWNLPHAEDIKFTVSKSTTHFARCHFLKCVGYSDPRYGIEVSERKHKTLAKLLESMAHEMCHIYQDQLLPAEREHGRTWAKLADITCRAHQFDRGSF